MRFYVDEIFLVLGLVFNLLGLDFVKRLVVFPRASQQYAQMLLACCLKFEGLLSVIFKLI